MRLKSYFSPTVEGAIERARQELGPEAMLLNTRKLGEGQEHRETYEVVFGITGEALQRKPAPAIRPVSFQKTLLAVEDAAANLPVSTRVLPVATQPTAAIALTDASTSAPAKPVKRARKPAAKAPALVDELAELRKQIQAVQNSLSHSRLQAFVPAVAGNIDGDTYRQLVGFDFSDVFARDLLAESDPTSSTETIVESIHDRFEVAPTLGRTGPEQSQIAMFVGPPGAGKTTTVAKLAIRMGVQRRIPVQLISLDTMRVGGSEQLAEYARIIGVDFRALYSAAALEEVLADSGAKLILIDTPGYAPAEMEAARENARVLREHPEIDVHLVLPASLRTSAFEKFAERFSVFGPAKLLFTHLDEVDTFGPLIEHAMKTGLPLSFFTGGQSIPQDLEEASKERLTKRLIASEREAAVSAA